MRHVSINLIVKTRLDFVQKDVMCFIFVMY